ITGAAKRVGAAIARLLHQQGMNIILHYHTSATAAQTLQIELNELRAHSVAIVQADLVQTHTFSTLLQQAQDYFGQLDVLINNASGFYPTPIGTVTITQWDDLLATNLKAPFFLSQAAMPYLASQRGCIINIVDIHATTPLKNYAVYCMAKAG